MIFTLKPYQQRCLDELRAYLRRTGEVGAKMAFLEKTERPYRSVVQLPGLPYVCVRVPTGGGKTVLAAYGVGLAAKEYLHAERCVVLWLAPTNTIVGQTLTALKNPRHPYRLALHAAFGSCVTVMELSEALYLQRGTLDSDAVVIVSTLAALRVENTEGRKVYESNGALHHHFTGLTEEQQAQLDKGAEGSEVVPCSLANVLRLRRPVVIVDEAHNARTPLSFDTLARFHPSCILEFTATPDQEQGGSNVLTHVSAAELKGDEMIKLPIFLTNRPNWKEAVQGAIAKQAELEKLAKEEERTTGEYLRPIVLFQAQSKSKLEETITVERLKDCLLNDFKIKEEEVAVATGTTRELEDVDVSARACPLRYILTVQALKEGWDCPFAYVLCSVTNLSSKTAVEQVLGRILRLPQVRRKKHDALNHAYAFATSAQFNQAAENLTEALVEGGYESFEAQRQIEPDPDLPFGPLFPLKVEEPVIAPPRLEALPEELKAKVRFDAAEMKLVYEGSPLSNAESNALQDCCGNESDRKAVARLTAKSHGRSACPAALGEVFTVPALAVRIGGQLELFEDQFREFPWKLAECDAYLTEAEFSLETTPGQLAEVDVTMAGKIEYRFVTDLQRQLSLFDERGPKSAAELAVWLDRQIPHPDVTQTESGLFLHRLVQDLLAKHRLPLEALVAARYRLRDAAAAKINQHRRNALGKAYQQMLSPAFETPLETDPGLTITLPANHYPANRFYEGPMRFAKHYHDTPAAMNDEEATCASILDSLPIVRFWVRNLERDRFAFWLQTLTDKFYPDFVARLTDGRLLAVEYKGAHLLGTPDTLEKRAIGELWEARSKGRCLFRLVGKTDMEAQLRALSN